LKAPGTGRMHCQALLTCAGSSRSTDVGAWMEEKKEKKANF